MIVGANCVRPLMIDNKNVVIYTKNAQNRNIFWRTQFAPTMIFANEKLAIRDDTATGEDTASPLQVQTINRPTNCDLTALFITNEKKP